MAKSNTMLFLGLGAAAVAAYFLFKPKRAPPGPCLVTPPCPTGFVNVDGCCLATHNCAPGEFWNDAHGTCEPV